MIDSRPSYNCRPIGSLSALARALSLDVRDLHDALEQSDSLYRLVCRKPKKGGGFRELYEAREPLKSIQKLILARLLHRVEFPGYLMGGVRDPDGMRGYIRNAELHAGVAILVTEDVSDFFPSVSLAQVQMIYQHLLHFPPAVAWALARLCTRNGHLPQGASTSTALANLVLFQREPQVAEELFQRGFRYSRFVDDINASSITSISDEEATTLVSTLRSMIERSGFAPKRAKQRVLRPRRAMRVHNLNINERASIPSRERKRIRAMIYQLEQRLDGDTGNPVSRRDLDRVTSHAARVKALHPHCGRRLVDRVRIMKNVLGGRPLQRAIVPWPRLTNLYANRLMR